MRTAIAILLGLCASLWMLIDLGGAALAREGSRLALAIPFQKTTAARSTMLEGTAELSASRTRVAIEGLRRSPLLPDALVELAQGARFRGDAPRDAALLDIASELGWRQDRTQMELYQTIAAGERPERAIPHAAAILRRNRQIETTSALLLDDAKSKPRMASSLLKTLGASSRWGDRFLVSNASGMPDAWLEKIFLQRRQADLALDRNQHVSMLASLMAADRFPIAYRLAAVEGGLPVWPGPSAQAKPGPFDWRLPAGYRVDGAGESAMLVKTQAARNRAASVTLGLSSGSWRINLPAGTEGAWRFAFRCGANAGRPVRPLQTGVVITVPEGCVRQTMSVSTAPGAREGRLGVLQVERVDGT